MPDKITLAKLVCLTGQVDVNLGDRFTDGQSGEWEVVGFRSDDPRAPSEPGITPVVIARPVTSMPSWFAGHQNADGTLDWCGDSVAACMLTATDGRPRSSRGDLLVGKPHA